MNTAKALESARCVEINIENMVKMMPLLKMHPQLLQHLLPIVKAQIKDVIRELELGNCREEDEAMESFWKG